MEEAENQNDNEVIGLIDSLPYYDKEYEVKSMKRRVNKLIEDEMKNMNVNLENYVTHHALPPPATFDKETHPFLFELKERFLSGRKIKMYDEDRYRTNPMIAQNTNNVAKENTEEMKKIVVQMGYLRQKMGHLQMLKENCKRVWQLHNQQLREVVSVLQQRSKVVKDTIEKVNKKRKREQIECGNEIDRLRLDDERLDNDIDTVEGECKRLRKKRKLMVDTFQVYENDEEADKGSENFT